MFGYELTVFVTDEGHVIYGFQRESKYIREDAYVSDRPSLLATF